MSEPIEEHLDALWSRLPADPREARRIVAEVESHLHEAAEAHQFEGLDRVEAETLAVAEFGAPSVAAPPLGIRDLLRPVTLFAAVGLLAIGASGLVAWAMRALTSPAFMAGGLRPGESRSRCAYYLEYYPSSSCFQSAAMHHAQELVVYRLAVAGVGVLLLVAWTRLPRGQRLAPGLVGAVGFVVYGAATAVLVVLTYVDARQLGDRGTGQWASAAPVTLVAALAYLVGALRAYRPVANRPFVAPRQP